MFSLAEQDFYLNSVKVLVTQSYPTLCDHGLYKPTKLLCPWNPPGKDTEVGSHFLLHQDLS